MIINYVVHPRILHQRVLSNVEIAIVQAHMRQTSATRKIILTLAKLLVGLALLVVEFTFPDASKTDSERDSTEEQGQV